VWTGAENLAPTGFRVAIPTELSWPTMLAVQNVKPQKQQLQNLSISTASFFRNVYILEVSVVINTFVPSGKRTYFVLS